MLPESITGRYSSRASCGLAEVRKEHETIFRHFHTEGAMGGLPGPWPAQNITQGSHKLIEWHLKSWLSLFGLAVETRLLSDSKCLKRGREGEAQAVVY